MVEAMTDEVIKAEAHDTPRLIKLLADTIWDSYRHLSRLTVIMEKRFADTGAEQYNLTAGETKRKVVARMKSTALGLHGSYRELRAIKSVIEELEKDLS